MAQVTSIGLFPFCIPTTLPDGSPLVEGVDYGAGTQCPVAFTEAEMLYLFWKVKVMKVDASPASPDAPFIINFTMPMVSSSYDWFVGCDPFVDPPLPSPPDTYAMKSIASLSDNLPYKESSKVCITGDDSSVQLFRAYLILSHLDQTLPPIPSAPFNATSSVNFPSGTLEAYCSLSATGELEYVEIEYVALVFAGFKVEDQYFPRLFFFNLGGTINFLGKEIIKGEGGTTTITVVEEWDYAP
jgi:hypothetical protein